MGPECADPGFYLWWVAQHGEPPTPETAEEFELARAAWPNQPKPASNAASDRCGKASDDEKQT